MSTLARPSTALAATALNAVERIIQLAAPVTRDQAARQADAPPRELLPPDRDRLARTQRPQALAAAISVQVVRLFHYAATILRYSDIAAKTSP